MATAPLWIVAVEVPRAAGDSFHAAFEEIAGTYSCFEAGPKGAAWRFEALVEAAPDRASLAALLGRAAAVAGMAPPDFGVARLPDKDWLAENRKQFPPVRAGRFFVYGSYFEGAVPAGSIAVKLDAGLAFGSGTHESTRGCLLALDRLARRRRFQACLDLGTGSGILAIAMAKLWRRPVTAADIDPVAVEVTRANARRNRVGADLRPTVSAGARALKGAAPYDLIVANILARPLERLAPALARRCTPDGALVLSGILNEQVAGVLAAYRVQGRAFKHRIVLGRWSTLILG